MVKKTRCNIGMKEERGSLVMTLKGYCDEKNPKRMVNKEIKLDFKGLK